MNDEVINVSSEDENANPVITIIISDQEDEKLSPPKKPTAKKVALHKITM